jgi:hypothetical protein
MNDLRNGEPLKQQVVSVLAGGPVDLAGPAPGLQHVNQLIEEQGNAVIDLRFAGRRHRSRGDLSSAPRDDFLAV